MIVRTGVLASFALACVVRAQSVATIRIPEKVACAACAVNRVRIVSLGADGDPIDLGTRAAVGHDARGRWFVSSLDERQVAVFDSGGKFQSALGRSGPGPGEISGSIAKIFVGPGDSIFVAERFGRVSVFAPDLRYARTFQMGVATDSWMTTSGEVVVPTNAGRASWPLQVRSATGATVRSFGLAIPSVVTPRHSVWATALAAGDGSVWANEWSEASGAVADHWSGDGKLLARVALPAWGPAPEQVLRQDTRSLLWTGSKQSTDTVRPEGIRTASGGTLIKDARGFEARMLEHQLNVLHVYDIRRGEMLATARLDGWHEFIGDSDLAFTRRLDADGFVRIDVWRMSVTGLGPR